MAPLLPSFRVEVVAADHVVEEKFLAINYVDSYQFGSIVCYPTFLIMGSIMRVEATPKKGGQHIEMALCYSICRKQGCVPEKIPIPNTREIWLEYGYLPNINTRKSLLTHTQIIPNTRAKYPACWVGIFVQKRSIQGSFFDFLTRIRHIPIPDTR